MRFQGKIANWNDDKGFGFVEPNGGGDRAFVHIKAFNPRSRRPIDGEVIIYELVRENDRYKATNVKFARDAKVSGNRSKKKERGSLGTFFAILFCLVLFTMATFGKLAIVVTSLYLVMSFITFVTYAMDKSAAQKGRWRTKESTLHLLSALGGWPGAFIAQRKLRHKSSKVEFKRVYWVTVVLNLGGLFWLQTDQGMVILHQIASIWMGR
ncbi:DUF1294 domain-containing protein [Motilimonas eburnea]|uniref:DUF1294 domain-containing protein n=1 Tax=Motilimonas eburnea TaxID=1737488 RepID=UPI001E4167AB|nr:cold shock and DUF1294 domain-containing protein [Motilimonas eburnea]MCE2571202.1 cold shock and DUF1294 domain-containing protein [Motilimonas eburnea]